ncbi:MAG TPA: glycosyltransferase family 2 protein [Thermoanaerobaculia bacterium]|nr:glycosyltransferase family 2 protein [Thermoanaerobaculia bacterium]
MRQARVAAIVLSYNGREVLLQALASLGAMSYTAFDLIVVDNGSTDGSEAAVREASPAATVVRTEQNLGPAGGLNLGIRWALERDYDFLLLLNNDIEVEPTMLDELVAAAERHPDAAAIGPKIYYHGERRRIWSAGGIIRFKESVTRERGQRSIDHGQFDREEEVDYVNGCAMLIPRRAFSLAGLWDPVFFLSVEDADWCTRAKRHDLHCYFAPRAIVYHMVSFTTGDYRAGRTYHTGRSTAVFIRRYATPFQWMTYLLFSLAAFPLAYLRELKRGNQKAAVAKMRGMWDGLRIPIPEPPPAPES